MRLNLKQNALILVLIPVAFELVFLSLLNGTQSGHRAEIIKLTDEAHTCYAIRNFQLSATRAVISASDSSETAAEQLNRLKKAASIAPSQELVAQTHIANDEFKPLISQSQVVKNELAALIPKINEIELSGATMNLGARSSLRDSADSALKHLTMLGDLLSAAESRLHSAQANLDDALRSEIITIALGWVATNGILAFLLSRHFKHEFVMSLRVMSSNAEKLLLGEERFEDLQNGALEILEIDNSIRLAASVLDDAKEKELAILENAADVICSLDEKLRFRNANAVVSRVWQYTPQDLTGMSLFTLLASEDLDATKAAFKGVQEAGEGQLENVVVCKDGRPKNLLWKVNWSEQNSGYFCVVHDISELRAIEKLKRHFIAIVSHDLRTPLTSVGVCLAFLLSGRRGFIPDEVRSLLELAQRSAARLMDLVNELLELEKLGSGKFILNPICVSVADVTAAARENVEKLVEVSAVKIKGPLGDALCFADQARLLEVMTNLLSNAIRSSPKGATVTVSIVKDASDFVKVCVADEGSGIPLEERVSIYEKFQRAAAGNTLPLPKSSGLGLAIVKALIVAHGGQVGVEANQGAGAFSG